MIKTLGHALCHLHDEENTWQGDKYTVYVFAFFCRGNTMQSCHTESLNKPELQFWEECKYLKSSSGICKIVSDSVSWMLRT